MHGRTKVKASAEQEEAKKKARAVKVKVYREVTGKIYEKRAAGDKDDEALKLTRNVLTQNPEITTLWNYRREIFLERFGTMSVEESSSVCVGELSFLEYCLKVNPKAYSIWHHRQWVMEHTPCPDWKNEKTLCDLFLGYDERNFHCWDYRRFVISKSPDVTIQDEFDFTYNKIASNFSNYSSWHYRSKLLPKLHPSPGKPGSVAEDALLKEHEMVQNAFFTDPCDQSAWIYQRWLLGKVDKPLAISCVLVRKSAEFAVYVTFNQPVKLTESFPMELITGSTSLVMSSDSDWPEAVHKCRVPDEGGEGVAGVVRVKYRGLEVEVVIREEEDVSWYLASAADMFGSTLTKATSTVLQSELSSCQELMEMEPDNKWCTLTVVALMQALDADTYSSNIADMLSKLCSIDPYRTAYYQDLLSKFVIEQTLKQKLKSSERRLNLANKGLSKLYFTEYLQLYKCIDLSGNSLSRLPADIQHLVSLSELILDNNLFEQLPEEVRKLESLEVFSLKNNKISALSAITHLKELKHLKCFSLTGNPLCQLHATRQELSELIKAEFPLLEEVQC